MREIRKATDDLKSTFEQEMVRLDEPEQPRMLQPVSGDPAAARASALAAASASPAPADPASARAAARRAAAGPDATAAARIRVYSWSTHACRSGNGDGNIFGVL